MPDQRRYRDNPDQKVRAWGERKRAALRERGVEVERRMRELVEGVVGKKPPEGFDPLDLLQHPSVGAELRRLGLEWFDVRARYWAAES